MNSGNTEAYSVFYRVSEHSSCPMWRRTRAIKLPCVGTP